MTAPTPPGHNWLGAVTSDLALQGWSWQPDFLPDALYQALRTEILAFDASEDLTPAGIGRDGSFQLDRSVRRTRIAWLDGQSETQAAFLAWTEDLRAAINAALIIGLFEFEACYAVYPPGGFYDRHLDSFEGARNRVLSLVVYLNEDWPEENGGALVIWPELAGPEAEPAARVQPARSGVAFLLSETVPHAVEVTHARRYAIAGWWRVNPSVAGRLDPIA